MDPKFREPEKDLRLNDVDWCNFHYKFVDIFDGEQGVHIISPTEVSVFNPDNLSASENGKPTFKLLESGHVRVCKNNVYDFANGTIVSKFMLLSRIRFKNDNYGAMAHIRFMVRKIKIPYIRVGVDYYKIIEKQNRYGAIGTLLKPWSKDEIKLDHSSELLKTIDKWDDFTIVPANTNFSHSHRNCYNLYAPFPHSEATDEVSEKDIPSTMVLLNHIFKDQLGLGLKYLKILYEDPGQILPVLILVSPERETGKTTFLNWIHMLFGENAVLISPQELTSNFNSSYATKNIIMIDETVIEKSTSVEKLKSLATAKTISVSQKFVAHYSVPFFGKIIICTNKEKDFMRVDEEEIRFWIRKIHVIDGKKNTNIENDLFEEIPKFLKFLTQQPAVDKTKSRMVFTKEEIDTLELADVKEESKSWLRKELEIMLADYFDNSEHSSFHATAKDIKTEWFRTNHQITMAYIRRVLKNEMKIPVDGLQRYYPFNKSDLGASVTGRPFLFARPTWMGENGAAGAGEPAGVGDGGGLDESAMPF